MTVLLTGGSGFLGSHVAEQLSKQGKRVRALVRKTSDTRFLRSLSCVELFEGAVDDRESLLCAARGAEAIVHAAGLVKARGPNEFSRVNTQGTENALAAALENRESVRRFVLVSSLAVAGPSQGGQPVSDVTAAGPV